MTEAARDYGWGALRGERPRSPRVQFVGSRQPGQSPEGIATKATPEGRAEAAHDRGCTRLRVGGSTGGASALPPGTSRVAASAGAEPRRDCNKGHAGGASGGST